MGHRSREIDGEVVSRSARNYLTGCSQMGEWTQARWPKIYPSDLEQWVVSVGVSNDSICGQESMKVANYQAQPLC
jgi:hypothetical protein